MLMNASRFLVISRRILVFGTVTGSLIGLTVFALAGQDLPVLPKGLWELQVTLGGGSGQAQAMTAKKCTNPMEDLKKQNEILAKDGCKVSSITRKGHTYSYSTQCVKQGVSTHSKSVITVDGDASYRIDAQSQQGGQQSTQTLVARRVGDC